MKNEFEQEQLSAFMDGELDRFSAKRIIDQAMQDPRFIERWRRYHIIRDAFQHGLHSSDGDELYQRVRRTLTDQPGARRPSYEWLKPVAGFALAASVAVVAVLGVRSMDSSNPLPGGGFAENTSPSQAVVERVDLEVVARKKPGPAASGRERLKRYLVEHAGQISGQMNGALPYARIVSYDSAY